VAANFLHVLSIPARVIEIIQAGFFGLDSMPEEDTHSFVKFSCAVESYKIRTL